MTKTLDVRQIPTPLFTSGGSMNKLLKSFKLVFISFKQKYLLHDAVKVSNVLYVNC